MIYYNELTCEQATVKPFEIKEIKHSKIKKRIYALGGCQIEAKKAEEIKVSLETNAGWFFWKNDFVTSV